MIFGRLIFWRDDNDSSQIAALLLNIGFLHYKVGNFDKAIDYSEKSWSLTARRGGKLQAALSCVNIGTIYVRQGNIPEAQKWIKKGIASCAQTCPFQVSIPAEFALGYAALHLDSLHDARVHFEHSHKLAVKFEDHRFQAENLIYLAQIANKEKSYSKAKEYLIASEQISRARDYRNLLVQAYFEFFELYRNLKQTDKAWAYLEQHLYLRDSIHSSEVRNKISVLEFEFNEREHAIEVAHNEQLLAKQKAQIVLTAIICVLSIFIAIGLFIMLRGKQRANKRLDQRVLDRTKELELHKDALERAYHEQSELIAKTSQSIKSALATQRGLNAAVTEVGQVDQKELAIGKSMEIELRNLAEEIAKADRFENPQSAQKWKAMKTILLIVFLSLATWNLYSQDQHMIDSVTLLIKDDGSRSDMEIFYELGFQYLTRDQTLSLQYLDKGCSIANKIADSLMIVKFNRMIGQALRRDGRQVEAIVAFEKVLPMAMRPWF